MHRTDALAQLEGGRLFLADGGLETTLIFRDGIELPCFASFTLLDDAAGRAALEAYYAPYLALAAEHGTGIVLDTPTWRASADWGERLGRTPEALDDANRAAVALMQELRGRLPATSPALVNGVLGPRGDGYVVDARMTADAARAYHARQLETLADAGADTTAAVTLTYADEAIGVVRAARDAGLPVVVSFTVETDGRLPSGEALPDAIAAVDDATGGAAAFFMLNCAHPTHFAGVLEQDGAWRERIRGVRPNASRMSHAELDEAEEIDAGDPAELASHFAALREQLPRLAVVGGCCGTDERHVAAICAAMGG